MQRRKKKKFSHRKRERERACIINIFYWQLKCDPARHLPVFLSIPGVFFFFFLMQNQSMPDYFLHLVLQTMRACGSSTCIVYLHCVAIGCTTVNNKSRKKQEHSLIKRICIVCIVKLHYCITYTIQVTHWLYNMPSCLFSPPNNIIINKNDDYIYVHNSVTSYICHLRPNKQHWERETETNNSCHLGPRSLNWNKHSQTQYQNKVLFPLRLRLDKFNKLNKRATRKFRCFPWKCGGRWRFVSQMPLWERACLSREESSSLCSRIHSSIHSSIRPSTVDLRTSPSARTSCPLK